MDLDIDGERWECPYDEVKDGKCIFHLPLGDKDNEEAEKEARKIIAKDTEEPAKIIGGIFGNLTLSEINRPLVLSYSNFDSFRIEEGTTVNYGLEAQDTTYDRHLVANQVEFMDVIQFGSAMVQTGDKVHGSGKFSFRRCTFHDDVYFKHIDCGRLQISRSTFHGKADLGQGTFREDSRVKGTTFHEMANFRKTTHHDQTEFNRSTFNGWTRFFQIDCKGRLTFSDVTFNTDEVTFELSQLENSLYMVDANLDHANFERADVRRCDFTNTSLKSSNLKQTDFRDSVLNGVDLRGSEIKGFKLAGAKLDEDTAFLGDPDDVNPAGRDHSLLSLIKPKPCVYDPRADFNEQARENMTEEEQCNEAKSIYHTIEQAARQSSRPQLLSEAFVYRQDIQKRQYWTDMKNTVENIERDTSERLIAAGRWARAKTARVTLLYGESPWRIVGWSGLIVALFAFLFTFGGYIRSSDLGVMDLSLSQAIQQPAMFGDTLAHAIYYSMMTYISFGPLGYEPLGMGKLLVTVESALGAVMIALLVFVFGRRAAR